MEIIRNNDNQVVPIKLAQEEYEQIESVRTTVVNMSLGIGAALERMAVVEQSQAHRVPVRPHNANRVIYLLGS